MPSLVAFVLVGPETALEGDAVVTSHAALGRGVPALAPWVPEEDPERPLSPGAARGLSFRFADQRGEVLAVLIPVPVPGGEADAAAAASLGRLGAAPGSFPAHAGHVTVLLADPGGELRPTEALVRLTRAAAAIADACRAVGVYWGAGNVTHEAGFFRENARGLSGDDLALQLWSGVRLTRAGDRLELLSLGLRQLDLPELLLSAPAAQLDEALARFLDLQARTVAQGQPPREGEAIDEAAVRYETSPLRDDEEVWRVELPSS